MLVDNFSRRCEVDANTMMDLNVKMSIFFALFCLLSLPTLAGERYCNGKVENVYVEPNGNVIIKGAWREHWTRIYNTKEDDVGTCSLWASYAATAVKDNLDVTVRYMVSDGSTCATLPTYGDSPAL